MIVLIAIIGTLLISAILIQNPKNGSIDASIGSQTNRTFGIAKSDALIEKTTWCLAIGLFVLCIASTLMLG